MEGYRLHAEARQLSEHTLADYFTTFTRFQLFLEEDLPLAEITDQDIERFMASLKGISKKTALNYHTGLSALWTWAVEGGFVETHIVRQVEPPDPETKDIIPFTEQEVKLMLAACHRSQMYWLVGLQHPAWRPGWSTHMAGEKSGVKQATGLDQSQYRKQLQNY